MELARRLDELIASSGHSRSEVARRSGLRPDQLYSIVSGRKPNPTAETLLAVLGAMGLEWNALDGVDSIIEK